MAFNNSQNPNQVPIASTMVEVEQVCPFLECSYLLDPKPDASPVVGAETVSAWISRKGWEDSRNFAENAKKS